MFKSVFVKCARSIAMACINLFSCDFRSLQELQVRFEPPGIMGIPPPPLTGNDTPSNNNPAPQNQPNDAVLFHDSTDLPPLLHSSSDIGENRSKLDGGHVPVGVASQYAPGQSSPSVKLLSPETILSLGISSPTTSAPSLSLPAGAHLLRSPSDFESAISLPSAITNTGSESVSSLSNSQIVTLPLKTLSSTDDEGNEEMVMTSPSTSLPKDANNNNEMGLFPSAHNSAIPLSLINEATPTSNPPDPVIEEEDDDWPNLSVTDTEQKSEPEAEQGDVPSSGGAEVEGGDSKDVPEDSTSVIAEAKDVASVIVASAINTAIGIIEANVPPEVKGEEGEEGGGDEEVSGKETEEREERTLEGDGKGERGDDGEEEEEEVKSKVVAVDVAAPLVDHSGASNPLLGVTSTPVDGVAVTLGEQVGEAGSDGGAASGDRAVLQSLVELVQQQQLEIRALRYTAST